MKEEILVKLRSAEDENAKRVQGAKERASELLKQARLEAAQRIEAARDEARRAEEERVAAERKTLETERQRILAEGKRQEDALRASYKQRVERHVEKALESFERNL